MKLICSLLVASTLGFAERAADSDGVAVREFYALNQKLKVTGLPSQSQMASLSPYLSPAMQAALRKAAKEQARCMKKFKDEKPPWIEGDLFTSNFEGFTGVESIAVKTAGPDRRVMSISFAYTENGQTFRWSDDVVLVSGNDGRWMVDDVRFRGGQEFTSGFGSSLRGSLESKGCDN
jgi:hypothetical protein